LKTIRSQQTPGSADGAPRRLPRRVESAKAVSDRTSWSLDRIRGKGLACLAQAITRNRSWRTVTGAPGSGQPSSLGQADGPAAARGGNGARPHHLCADITTQIIPSRMR
jgi:hypothetical protein